MDHGTLRQLAAGAALDDLDPAERRELDAHLRGCSACAELTRDLDDVLCDLALATPEMAPPPALRRSILRALPGAASASPTGPTDDRTVVSLPARRSRTWRTWAPLGLAAVVALAVIGLGARTVQLDGAAAVARTQVAEQAAALAVVADPAHRTASLTAEPAAPNATAVVVYRPGTRDAFILADHLPATPDGMVYQLWAADSGGVHPLATFHHDGVGPFLASFGVDLGASAAAMVTLEPIGGATGEPGPQVVFGEL
jgi:anti-sigma-K factor RskA